MVEHAGEKGMNGEVTAPQTMVKATEHGQPIPIRRQRPEQRCFCKARGPRLGKKLVLLKAEQIADRHEAGSSNAGPPGCKHRRPGLSCQRRKCREGKRAAQRANDETATAVHGGFRRLLGRR